MPAENARDHLRAVIEIDRDAIRSNLDRLHAALVVPELRKQCETIREDVDELLEKIEEFIATFRETIKPARPASMMDVETSVPIVEGLKLTGFETHRIGEILGHPAESLGRERDRPATSDRPQP
jgi:hypothetical protein